MFKSVPANKKFVALILLGIILILSSFKKSFYPTLSIYRQQKGIDEKLSFIREALPNVSTLQSEVDILNNKLGSINLSAQEVQQRILLFSTQLNDIEVVDVAQIHYSSNPLFKIYTHQITFNGDFQDLLEGLYAFEKKFLTSRIVNFHFESNIKNGQLAKNQSLRITFQNYEKNN